MHMPGPRAPKEKRRQQIVSAAYEVALRRGIDGVTLRAVAAKAGLSHGLVVFYFKQRDQLISALLDRVLATSTMLDVAEQATQMPNGPERLRALLRQELGRLTRDPRATRLFYECWALGVQRPAIRRRIGAALERYRAAFTEMAEGLVPTGSAQSPNVTPVGLAAVAVSLISGFAVQTIIDPEQFDTTAYLVAVEALIERLTPAPS